MTQTDHDMTKRMGIFALTWPIFIETALRMLLGVSDVFMLSGYSDNAVAAVGLTSQLIFFLIIISMMASSGASILISQANGSGDKVRSSQVAVIGIVLAAAIGTLLGLGSFALGPTILSLYDLDAQVYQFSVDYLQIAGSGIIGMSVGITFSAILRCHGFSKAPMLINLFTGLANIIGNYCVLYSPFDIPVYGVAGVATVTVCCQLLAALIMWIVIRRKKIDVPLCTYSSIPKSLYKRVVKLGILNAGEMLSYNIAQMVMMYMVTKMGTAALTAHTYALNITRFCFTFALSVGQATQIQTGYYVGKQWFNAIARHVTRYYLVSLLVSATIAATFAFFRYDIVGLFTQQPEVIEIATSLLIISIILETGRVSNLVFISALRGAGDMAFTVKIGIFSMWLFGVGIAYLLGVNLAWGVIGVWLGTTCDEWVRGVIMLSRWRSKRWQPQSCSPETTKFA